MRQNLEKRAQTREKMFQAFFEEYKLTPLRSITVAMVSNRAGVNRSTFYGYFFDMYDLLEQAQTTLLVEIMETAKQVHIQLRPDMKTDEIRAIMLPLGEELLRLYGSRIAVLLDHGDNGFSKKLAETMQPMMQQILKIDAAQPNVELLISFALSGVTGYITSLYRNGEPTDVKEATRLIQSMLAGAVEAFMLHNSTMIK